MSIRELCAGLPVTFGSREGDGSVISWRDNGFALEMSGSIASLGEPTLLSMWAHDVGHIIAATDAELLLPNLGLPITDRGMKPWLAPSPEDTLRQETSAMGVQLMFEPDENRRGRLLKTARALFKVTPDHIKAWEAEWDQNRVRAVLKQQIEKMQAWS